MPRAIHAPLTDQRIRSIRPGKVPIDVRDGELRGLILTVLPSGRKQFSLRYRAPERNEKGERKQRRLSLGEYPALSLSEARKRARKQLSAVDDDRDPVGEREAARAAKTDTVRALTVAYLDEHARPNKRTAAEDERALNTDVLPPWGARSVKSLTRADVKALLKPIVARGSPIMANRVLALVRKLLNFAVDEEWIDANPAARVKKPGQEKSRARVLTDDELRRLWAILSRQPTTAERGAPGRPRAKGSDTEPICPISPTLAALLKVRLLTAQRGGEVVKMRWADVDLDAGWWTIPGSDTKNGEPHRVPLVKEVVALLHAEQKRQEALAEKRRAVPDDDEHRDDTPSPFVFVGVGASVRDRAKKAPGLIAAALKMDFRGHDLRRTAATRMAEAGITPDHISRVLNHVEGGPRATHVYNRYNYDDEKVQALETWARTLKTLVPTLDGARPHERSPKARNDSRLSSRKASK